MKDKLVHNQIDMSSLLRLDQARLAQLGLSVIALVLLLNCSSVLAVDGFRAEQKPAAHSDPFGWDHIESIARPRALWWWLGSSVSKPEIDRQLQSLKNAGFGGLLICPLYEYENPVLPSIPYLSDEWNEMFKYACVRGKELNLGIDMTIGGGWPMGGPWVSKDHGERYLRFEKKRVVVGPGQRFELADEPGKDPIECVTCLKDFNQPGAKPAVVITPKSRGNKKVWEVPEGTWDVLIARLGYTKFDVYVAGPGAVGPVFDFWSADAFANLVEPFPGLLKKTGNAKPTYAYCDSYEGRGGWTPDFFNAFAEANGYDLRPFLHHFLKEDGTPENQRIWHDHRYTISRLHVAFTKRWTQWAHQQGIQTLYQWIGDPANPLDTCAEVDLPDAAPAAVHAAHIMGKRLVSNETFTWGAGHNFNGTLDYFRKAADSRSGILGGVNLAMFHGAPFTPAAEPWPGPMYYAGANFSETQPWFPHLKYLNTYLARLQQTLQHTKPDVEVLVLSSLHDSWLVFNKQGWDSGQPLVWRNSEHPGEGGVTVAANLVGLLESRGIPADLCSDKLLQEMVQAKGGRLVTPGTSYKVLLVPALGCVEPETLKKLEQLAANGATILFIGTIPRAIPRGLPLAQDTSSSTARLEKMIGENAATDKRSTSGTHQIADASGDALGNFLARTGVLPDGLPGRLAMLRAVHEQEPVYFFKNDSETHRIDAWVTLNRSGQHAIVGNARTGIRSLAQSRPSTNGVMVHLVVEPSEMLVVKLTSKSISEVKPFEYFQAPVQTNAVQGPWNISWTDYDGAGHSRVINNLESWTQLDGLELYSGMVDYETSFTIPAQESGRHCELDLGEVCQSAEVWINGELVGCAWTTPFRLNISKSLRSGRNTLRLRVANLSQNRIIDMHRKQLPWQKWKLEENDFIGYCGLLRLNKLTPLASGLLGPVQLRSYLESK